MHVMIDLETMGNGPNAAILALGAIEFTAAPMPMGLGRAFYRVANLESAVRDGGEIDAETVMWWLHQSDEARSAISDTREPLRDVLDEFARWLAPLGAGVKIWGNGAAFDNVILAQAYRRAGIATPWDYRNDRCYRTLKALRPDIPMQRTGTHHNALDDARSQAIHLIEIMATLHTPPERTDHHED